MAWASWCLKPMAVCLFVHKPDNKYPHYCHTVKANLQVTNEFHLQRVSDGENISMPWRHHMLLTHWGRDKMAAISQTTHSNAFSWIKMLEIRLIFHWSLFLRVESTILHHWFRLWLDADQATSHYLNTWWLDYRRKYASLGLNELKHTRLKIPMICIVTSDWFCCICM